MKRFVGYEKGINLGGWLSQSSLEKEHLDTFITEKDIEKVASFGLDHLRLPVDYMLIQTEDGELIEENFRYIDNCIEWCKKRGINMILDLHKTKGFSFDAEDEYNSFFSSEALQDRFVELWDVLSKRYGKYSDFVSFELLNEILDKELSDVWNGIAKRAVEAIRKNAPTVNILIGSYWNNSVFSVYALDEPYDEHIIYNFHCYEPLVFTHQSAYWVKGMPLDFKLTYPKTYAEYKEKSAEVLPDVNNTLYDMVPLKDMDAAFFEAIMKDAIKVAEERKVALYCGEYGVIDRADLPSTLNWYRDINATFKKYGIGHAAWTYKSKDFGLTDEHFAPILDEIVKHL